jgi:hypothetical protein
MDEPVGAALNRSLSPEQYEEIEKSEQQLDRYLTIRYKQGRDKSRSEAEEEATWESSERKHRARREAQLRNEWWQYHLDQARRARRNFEALVAHHEAQAEKYLVGMQQDGRAA